jgi:hypothetical protein
MAVLGRLLSFRDAWTYLGMPEIAVVRDGRLGFYERDLDDWAGRAGPRQVQLSAAFPGGGF